MNETRQEQPTLRDQFAMAALPVAYQRLIARVVHPEHIALSDTAAVAWNMADAMLAERGKGCE